MLFATGCATAGTSTYVRTPPSPNKVENEIVVDKPFEETWDQLVKGLAKSFYVINNIEKASRIINISFSTERPEEFIDCGKTKRTYERGDDREEYVYNIASSSSYKLAGSTRVTHHVHRAASLEGRINIYVAPQGNKTLVSVNSRYILTVRIAGNSVLENVFGKPVGLVPLTPQSLTHSFNTNQTNWVDWGSPQTPDYVSCYSTGKLEGEILNMAR